MDPERERQLLQRLRRGDAAAFDQVYEAFRAPLFGFLVRMSKRYDLAEDLLQETWLRLARKAGSLRDDTHLLPWLFTVARNLFLSHRRWQLMDAERVTELARLTMAKEDAGSPFEVVAGNEAERQLEAGLAALPTRYREALLLVAVVGMSQELAARVSELKPAAFRKRLSRARAMLAKELGQGAAEGWYPAKEAIS